MIGKYPAKLDDKNRLFVPAKLRGELGSTFYVTIGSNCGHRCLTVYTEEGWRKLTDKYDQLPRKINDCFLKNQIFFESFHHIFDLRTVVR